ncbi:MAG: hypothetical protein JNJ59_21515 [Deltaproteobacteria bacterium]|jgi:hypothetical protein|nr:hypothetical protein [Deltaproteobacteria bacterium]
MPNPTQKLSLPRIALYVVLAIAAFLVLRFVFSVAMSVLKFVLLGALAVVVVYFFLAKDAGKDKDKRS